MLSSIFPSQKLFPAETMGINLAAYRFIEISQHP
jgi:hypothetical protein